MRKWRQVYERLPIERKDKTLSEISGFDKYCTDGEALRSTVFNNLLKESAIKVPGDVCEVGCGCADKLIFFDKAGYRCHGVDYSATMIERAKKEIPSGEFYHCDASELPFADNSMDLVFSYSVFVYFEGWDYAVKVLKEMYRIAKDNAAICIWDVPDIKEQDKVEAFRGVPEKGYEHTYYDMNDFIQWFKAAGVLKVKAGYFFIPVYKHSLYRFNVTAITKKG
jgi:ubiquinone/menaquinone biosynthesis C-methylase UbiE